MNIMEFLPLLAGIGLFLYGMSLVSSSLEKLAGADLEKTLEKLTNSKFKGVALGALVTAVIQSSAATTVMVVGFLNAGILKLAQAVPVIMGANIGTTITAQILSLSDLEGSSILISMLKPTSFAPILIAVGAFTHMLSKKPKVKNIALLCVGLGSLFFGMGTMETTLAPLKDLPQFQNAFLMFSNPFLGIILGAVVTAILQSSSASVGLLQALTTTGAITFSNAIPIILGQNIGTCFTVFLASIGANKNAKRAVFFHLSFNIIGTIIFLFGFYGIHYAIGGFSFWDEAITRGGIANFHTMFNIVNTILLLPFTNQIIAMCKKVIPTKNQSSIEESLSVLDQRFLNTPAVALDQAHKVLLSMGETATSNYHRAVELLYEYDEKKMEQLQEYEDILDRSEAVLGNYVVQITSKNINAEQNKQATEILHTIVDFERIGDHAVNMAEVAQYNHQRGISFSPRAREELDRITAAVGEILTITNEVCHTKDVKEASRIEPLEEVIDVIKEILKSKHIERLQEGKCSVQSGISFLELLTNLERISDHCSNIGVYVIKIATDDRQFDSHEHLRQMHGDPDSQYQELYASYQKQYQTPLEEMEKQEL